MSGARAAAFSGPVEAMSFPETLRARITTPGARPRVHGYDVEGDLARHYRTTDLLVLSLTGELPSTEASLAVDVVSMFLAPVSVAEAPAHAAVLARLSGASMTGAFAIAASALGEQARFVFDRHAPFLAWLDAPTAPPPPEFQTDSPEDASAVARLRTALRPSAIAVRALELPLTRFAALIAALHAAGIRRREHGEALFVWARLPGVLAEFLAEKPAAFLDYPMNLPRYDYGESP